MKRFIAIIVALVVMSVTVSAEIPGFLMENYNNYTANYSFTMSFEGGDEIVALLDETGALETSSRRVDIKALLESMFSSGSVATVKANISDDFRKVEVALTSEIKSNLVVNKNLNMDIDAKTGIWLRIDLDADEPVFEVIYSSPRHNKYEVFDMFKLADTEETRGRALESINRIFNKEVFDSIKKLSLELLEKHAKITMKGATCVIQIDNAGLVGMIKEIAPVIMNMTIDLDEIMGVEPYEGLDYETEEKEFPDFDDIQILGKNGIVCKYYLFSGKISSADIEADFSIDLSKILEASGEEWPYQAKGILNFLLKSNVKLTNIGKTKVDFPNLAEEDYYFFEGYDYYDEEYYDEEYYDEEYVEYPSYYVWVEAEDLPVIDGEYYVPLREIFENAYEDAVNIDYNKGIINVSSEWFKGFKNIKFEVNSENAYVDGVLKKIPKVIVSNGKTYVGVSVFEDIFGWELDDIIHYISDGYFDVGFYTE